MKRPAFWIALALISVLAAVVAYRAFPGAFSIIALDISMDREHALAAARDIAARDHLGPDRYREAASFSLDDETQTFVELEGGGKDAFTAMMRDRLYPAYTWRVRHFREGEVTETMMQFSPDGRPVGFVERIKEDAPGAALTADRARTIAEAGAPRWSVDLHTYTLVEQGQEHRRGGRVDHTFTYERESPTLNAGRYRVRFVVSGDRLTSVVPFVKVPEAFTRRYASMRSANEAIGLGSVVAMIVLYVVGGMGFGLFLMLRLRWVVWGRAVWWGIVIAGLQTLATVNDWPLLWMGYDTAVSRATFFGQQLTSLAASFFGFSAIYALSFVIAETLTRRAFGSQPQFWRVWSRGPGSSTAVLGRTVGGYLLVTLFFAYDVVLYLVTTHKFGWWSPSEALFHPDVLASYVPWFSAIANSAQAGFWEECLFRAVPIAGAALIGDRFGKRRLFIVIAFVVQAIVFGSGHAPYPNQPAYARPVELIVPSIGFGLLYLYFGLLPGIILHFVFDTTWFALPLFVAHVPGIWVQQAMVIIVALVPLWVVLYRRVQAGRWTTLDASERNAAWQPEPLPETAPEEAPTESVARGLSAGGRTLWLTLGAIGVVLCGALAFARHAPGGLTVSRGEAIAIARAALQARHVTLPPGARFMARVDDGSNGPEEFVSETAGEARRAALRGTFLPMPRWWVRVATFEGDIASRAEEWNVFVPDTREPWPIEHQLPQSQPGKSLDESAARALAISALTARFHYRADSDLREISATPTKEAARMDWTFVFVDRTVPPLPQGEPRVQVDLAGDEVTSIGRSLFVPESYTRADEAASQRNNILSVLMGVIPAALFIGAGVTGLLAWSRRKYAPRLFFAALAQMFAATAIDFANQWPSLSANFSTAQPLGLQIGTIVGAGIVGIGLAAVFASLAMGALPARIAATGNRLDWHSTVRLGIAAGAIAAALVAGAAMLTTPRWAMAPDVGPLSGYAPILGMVLGPISGFFSRCAVVVTLLATLTHLTGAWGGRRVLEMLTLFIVGFTAAGSPEAHALGGWLAGGCLLGAGFMILSSGLLVRDLTMVPVAIGTSAAIGLLLRATHADFPLAWIGSIGGAFVIGSLAWGWTRVIRRHAAGR